MAGVKITELTAVEGQDVVDSDLLVIVDRSDGSGGATRSVTRGDLLQTGSAGKVDRVKLSGQPYFRANQASNDLVDSDANALFLLVSPVGTVNSLSTGADANDINNLVDSVGYVNATARLYFNPDDRTLYSTNGIRTNNNTGRLGGIADQALVADSANFNTTSLNDVVDTFTGLVTGQVLKWNGSQWANANDISGTAGVGVIAKQINTKSADDANNEFLLPLVRAVGSDSVEIDGEITYNASTNSLTVPNLLGNATSATTATNATNAITSEQLVVDSAGTETLYLIGRESNIAGADSAKLDAALGYNTTTETLFAPNFSGDGSSVSNVAAVSATTASAVNVSTVGDDATFYIHFGDQTTGTDALNVNTSLNYNPSTGLMTVDNISYTPSTDAHWADPNPTTVKSALDRLAAAVYALQSNTEIS